MKNKIYSIDIESFLNSFNKNPKKENCSIEKWIKSINNTPQIIKEAFHEKKM
jgi:hypothetical protein